MNARTGVWALIILVLVAMGVIVFGFKGFGGPQYTVADKYIDEGNPMNTVVFNFVEMEGKDTVLMKKIGNNFKNQHAATLKGKPSQKPVTVIVTQFYRQEDATDITPDAMRQLNIPADAILPIKNKLQYIPKGYIYVDFIKHMDLPGMKIPPATLSQMPFLGPKPGQQMNQIVKQLAPQGGQR